MLDTCNSHTKGKELLLKAVIVMNLTPEAPKICEAWETIDNLQTILKKTVTLPRVEKLIHISLVNALNLLDTLLTSVALNYKGAETVTESEISYYISECFRETIAHPNRIGSLNLDNLYIVRTVQTPRI